jgi:hypothetical protein
MMERWVSCVVCGHVSLGLVKHEATTRMRKVCEGCGESNVHFVMKQEEKLERFIDSLGLKYFKGREFTPYWSRTRGGVRNSIPPEELWRNIVPGVLVLDELRERLGAPISLLSTYRSQAYNTAVGGERNSFHMRFMAIDFTSGKGTPASWAAMLHKMRGKRFDLPNGAGEWVFRGGVGVYPGSNFVHVDSRGYDANW